VTAGGQELGILEIETAVFCRDLESGAVTVAPVAEPTWLSYGPRAEAHAALARFLEEHLITAPARVVARYGLPGDLTLRQVIVPLRRVDLPPRLQRELRLAVPVVVVPSSVELAEGQTRTDLWLILPTFDHTIYLRRGEDAEAVVKSEVQRLWAAHDLASHDALGLLPATAHRLEPLVVALMHAGEGLAGRARAVARARVDEHRRRLAGELLQAVSTPGLVEQRAPLPARSHIDQSGHIGHEAELRQLTALLGAKERQSILLVGDEGVGKTALMQAWRRQSPGRSVCATSAAQLVAGMSGFGEWQARVDEVMRAAELLDAVVYFESFAELFGERPEQGGLDVAGAIRRYVVDGRVRVVGELSGEALAAAIRHKPALCAAMAQLAVPPLSPDETLAALAARAAGDEAALGHEAAAAVVALSERYVPYRAFPGKALSFAAEVCAAARPGETVGADRVYDAFSAKSGIPAFLLHPERALFAAELARQLGRRVIGQREAVMRVAETLSVVKARLQPSGRPLATLLFVGPTGVGKTEVARALANLLFGADERMARFDMSEYADAAGAERLIRGSLWEGGVLSSRVRAEPFSVLLLDEIEKAHPAVFDLLLQVLGEGRLTDARGKTSFFHNAIIIMTSNIGAGPARAPLGLLREPDARTQHYLRAVAETFRPEFVGRLDQVVVFDALSTEEIRLVADIAIARLAERRGLAERGIGFDVTDEARGELARGGHEPRHGVRALRRYLDQHLVAPVARALGELGGEARGALVWVGVRGQSCSSESRRHRMAAFEHGNLVVEIFRRPAATGRRALAEVDAVADVRRELDALLDKDAVKAIVEHLAMLRAQLAGARRGEGSALSAEDFELMRREQHRVESALARIEARRADIRVAEQLCMSALFEGEVAGEWLGEAVALAREAQRAVLWLLVAQRAARDEVTLALFEPDGPGPLARWLGPLCDLADERGWALTFHVRQTGPHGQGWPSIRSWGPPRDVAFARARLFGGAHKSVLLRASGRDVGILLALEAGVHRFHPPAAAQAAKGGAVARHLHVRLATMKTELSAKSWYYPPLEEMPVSPRRGVAVARERFAGEVGIFKDPPLAIPDDAYWERIEEVALAHLLHHLERGAADGLFVGVLDTAEVLDAEVAP
jgi:ATP-dependent Clp protease ATP-binding subunit ClpC